MSRPLRFCAKLRIRCVFTFQNTILLRARMRKILAKYCVRTLERRKPISNIMDSKYDLSGRFFLLLLYFPLIKKKTRKKRERDICFFLKASFVFFHHHHILCKSLCLLSGFFFHLHWHIPWPFRSLFCYICISISDFKYREFHI